MFDSTDATGEKRRRYSGTPPQMPATFDAVDLRLAARSLTLLLSLSLGSGCGSRSALLTGDSPSTTSTGTTTGSTSAAAHYWSRTLPAGYAMTVASDAGGNVFLSSLCGDVDLAGNQAGIDRFCLAKLDPDGTLLWSRVFFGTGSTIRVDASENLWIAGYFKGTIDLGGGPLQSAYEMNDLFVAKLDPQGNHLFSARFGDEGGGDGTQLPGQLVTLPQGGVVLVGVFDGTLSFGGDVFSTVPSSANGFIARFDDKGDHVWSRALSDTPTLGYAAGAAVLPDGSVAVTGTYFAEMDCGGELLPDQGFGDIVVLKLDAEGKQVFCRSLGGPNEESGARIVATPDGGFWLTGYFAGPLPFGATELTPAGVNNGYLGRLGPDGGPVSARQLAADVQSTIQGLATNAAGEAVVSGNFNGSMPFGAQTLESPGGMFVARFSAAGDPLSARQFGEGESTLIDAFGLALDPADNVIVAGGFRDGTIDFGDEDSPHSAGATATFVAKLAP